MSISSVRFWDASGVLGGQMLRLVALLAVLALFAGACGGGDDDDGGSEPAPTTASGTTGGGGSAIGTTGSGATASGSAGGGATSGGGSAGGLGDIADLTGLESFRWDITMNGAGAFLGAAGVPSVPGSDNSQFTAEGSYIAPDQAQVTINVAGLEYKQTVKDGQQWTSVAGTSTGPVPATSDASDLIYVSSFVDPESVLEGAQMDCGGNENVNGVQARRCEASEQINDQLVGGLAGPGATTTDASFVIWVADEGDFIVKWELEASGTANNQPFEWSFVANITDVNNVDSIEP